MLKFILTIIFLLLIGCGGTSKTGIDSDHITELQEAYVEDTIRTYPPLQLEDAPPIHPQTPGFWTGTQRLEIEPYEIPEHEPEAQETETDVAPIKQIVSGYRVQLFAASKQQVARRVQLDAERRLGVLVYLVYVAPQYKVRAGDFTNRKEADNLCNFAYEEGFRDAWVVKSQVEIVR